LRAAGWYAGRPEPDLLQWLDLVALGTVCDVVPLTGVNRALVAQGIKVARGLVNPGMRALAAVGGVSTPIDAYHLGFVLGPRVNAGGRVGAADLGARLLATDDPVLADELAHRLDDYNRERRAIEAQTLQQAIAVVEAGGQSPALVFAAAEGWHPGVIGIVAARLKERYERPACVVALDSLAPGGIGRGSGRSVAGVALGPAIIAARQAGLLINGGGHAMAAGFTVAVERLDELREFLSERLGDGHGEAPPVPELAIDGALSVTGACAGLIDHIEALAPFGAANPEPRFAFPGLVIAHVEPVGANGAGPHLRMSLADPVGPARLKSIAFRVVDTPLGAFLAAARGRAVHVAGHLRRDDWHGNGAVQLVLDDAATVAG
jgi:single-stranded-DNA-specific exonuclease